MCRHIAIPISLHTLFVLCQQPSIDDNVGDGDVENDDTSAGELEGKIQRLPPRQGMILICPSGCAHSVYKG